MTLPPPIPTHGPKPAGWWSRHWRWAMPVAVSLLTIPLSSSSAGNWATACTMPCWMAQRTRLSASRDWPTLVM